MLKLEKMPLSRISQVVIKSFPFLFVVVVGEDHVDLFQIIEETNNLSKNDRCND
jgi:hypothetical protein